MHLRPVCLTADKEGDISACKTPFLGRNRLLKQVSAGRVAFQARSNFRMHIQRHRMSSIADLEALGQRSRTIATYLVVVMMLSDLPTPPLNRKRWALRTEADTVLL